MCRPDPFVDPSDRIQLIKMSRQFNDMGDSKREDVFRTDSTIWHCKKSHFYNEKFRREYLKYLEMIKGVF